MKKAILFISKHCGLFCVFLMTLTFSSCEEFIKFDLRDGSGDYVITAQADNYFGTSVIVQKTLPYFSDVNLESIDKGVSVKIIDHSENNKEYPLPLAPKLREINNPVFIGGFGDESAKVFKDTTLKTKKGHKYTVEVTIEGKTYRATATMPPSGLNITSPPKTTIEKEKDSEEYEFKSEYAVDLGDSAFGYVSIMKDQVHLGSAVVRAASPNSLIAASLKDGLTSTYSLPDPYYLDVDGKDARLYQGAKLCFVRISSSTYDYIISTNFLGTLASSGPPSKNPGNPSSSWTLKGDGEKALGHFYLQYITTYDLPPIPLPPSVRGNSI